MDNKGFLDEEGLAKTTELLKSYTDTAAANAALKYIKLSDNYIRASDISVKGVYYFHSMPTAITLNGSWSSTYSPIFVFENYEDASTNQAFAWLLANIGPGNSSDVLEVGGVYLKKSSGYPGYTAVKTAEASILGKTKRFVATNYSFDHPITGNYIPHEAKDLVTKEYVDGLITSGGGGGSTVDPETLEQEVIEQVTIAMASAFKYKGEVTDYINLPTNAETGDTYNIVNASEYNSAGDNAVWNGTSWDILSGMVDLSGYAKLTDLEPYAKTTDLTAYAKTADIPTKLSELTNDANYIDSTTADAKLSEEINKVNASVSELQTDLNTIKPTPVSASFNISSIKPGFYITTTAVEVTAGSNSRRISPNTIFWVLGSDTATAGLIAANDGTLTLAGPLSASYNNMSSIIHLLDTAVTLDNIDDLVLTKTNTATYTPTANYHPATKKYVDDGLANVSFAPTLEKYITSDNDPMWLSVGTGYTVDAYVYYTTINPNWIKLHGCIVFYGWPTDGWTSYKLCTMDLSKFIPFTVKHNNGFVQAWPCVMTTSKYAGALVNGTPQGDILPAVAKIADVDNALTITIDYPSSGPHNPAQESAAYYIWLDIDLFKYTS